MDSLDRMSFHDHFSHDSRSYREARPTYPAGLFAWLASISPTNELAWDCACGSGQASVPLSNYFAHVIATDASQAQLDEAERRPNIEYRLARAEDSGIADGSLDLVTVAQAAHWFDHDAFHREVKRILRPRGVVCVWSYGLHSVSPEVDEVIHRFYTEIVGKYWPPERGHVDDRYERLPFPFERVEPPTFEMTLDWTIESQLAYLNTWSSVKEYRKAKGSDPIPVIESRLRDAWGESKRRVAWPLIVLAGRLS